MLFLNYFLPTRLPPLDNTADLRCLRPICIPYDKATGPINRVPAAEYIPG